jgi:predicted integral membrane protein DUF2269
VDWLLAILLFLHIGGAIVAFGPTFVFPLIGAMGGREPQHVNFAVRINERIEERIVLPLAVLQGITGLLIVWRTGINIFSSLWLLVAIVLYLIALSLAFFVALPTTRKLAEATNAPPPPLAPGAPAPTGPPPHVAALVKRAQQTGMALAVLIVAIVFLMVVKPF